MILILFILTLIFYALLGFKAFKLEDHRGNLIWARTIFLCTLISVGVTYALIMARLPEALCNIVLIIGFIPGLICAIKYYRVNLYKFQPAAIAHIVYIWGALSMVATLSLEIFLPYGSNARKSEWGFTFGLAVAVVLIVILFLPKKGNTGISQ
ncbi:MAG: hypothetical protein K0S32_4176 [Bacteroidetes bacterium]|jgi:hypothetical protein|nr:hypothetical protein [Bacteroidota bacterium]